MQIPSGSLLAAGLFTATAVLTTFPLALRLADVVPGTGPGDNLATLWNTWWFLRAVAGEDDLFRTHLLFAPVGTQLSLHTHATTHSLLAWPWMGAVSVVSAHNIAILIGTMLNGLVTYLLAHRIAGAVVPALVAGWLVASSAFVHLHLLGHMNLLHVWVIPLFLLALLRFTNHPRPWSAVALGTAAALVVYTDYYFAIYCALMVAAWVLGALLTVRSLPALPIWLTASRVMFAVAGGAVALAAVIAATGGFVFELGGVRASVRTARNPLNVAWLCLLLGSLFRTRLRPAWRSDYHLARPALAGSLLALLVAAVLLAPLLRALADVIARGQYAAPRVLWRSSPPGGDLATLLLGHPAHALAGRWTQRAYERLGIDALEQTLWLGLVPLLLLVVWRNSWRADPRAGPWLLVGLIFAVLAAGPFLRVGGFDTGLTLPQAAVRYLPGISNARMPGRAVIVVQLSLAMLLAIAWRGRRPGVPLGSALAVVIVLESLPGRLPLFELPQQDAVDRALLQSGESGAIIELPAGLRDGFGEHGTFDHRALVHQMSHGRPLSGGFVARLSPRTRSFYLEDPALNALLAVSEGSASAVPPAGDLRAMGFTSLIINRDVLPEARLSRAQLAVAGFEFRLAAGSRELFSLVR